MYHLYVGIPGYLPNNVETYETLRDTKEALRFWSNSDEYVPANAIYKLRKRDLINCETCIGIFADTGEQLSVVWIKE